MQNTHVHLHMLMNFNRPDVNLVENMEGPVENPAGVELDDVRFTQNMEEFLSNEDWVNDAT